MQVAKLTCEGAFQNNTDRHLHNDVICYGYTVLLGMDPATERVCRCHQTIAREKYHGPPGDSDETNLHETIVMYLEHLTGNEHSGTAMLMPRPVVLTAWSVEPVCSDTHMEPVMITMPAAPAGSPAAFGDPTQPVNQQLDPQFGDAGAPDDPVLGVEAPAQRDTVAVIHPPATQFMRQALYGTSSIGAGVSIPATPKCARYM